MHKIHSSAIILAIEDYYGSNQTADIWCGWIEKAIRIYRNRTMDWIKANSIGI